jgi:signal recognition particle receptor subunit beta
MELLESPIFLFLIGSLILLFSVAALRIFASKGKKRNKILISGLSNSGKTVLFSMLQEGKFRTTQTSMKENEGTFSPLNSKTQKVVTVVDLPGHKRLRNLLDQQMAQCRKMIFLIDAESYAKEANDVAEFLFHILSNSSIHKNKIPILVVCNKQDTGVAASKDLIQQQLQKDIDTFRQTRKAFPTQSDENYEEIGKPGKAFTWEDLSNGVQFVNCALKEGTGLSNIVDFITVQ